MNFDLSNILTRSGQITWRHKSIWGLLLLPIVVAFLPFLMLAIFFLAIMQIVEWNIPDFMYIGFGIFFLFTLVVTILINYAVRAASSSAATLGIIRAERGEGSTKFMDLLKDGMSYFWRVLGVMAVVNLTIGLVFTIINLLAFLLIIVTLGLASFCVQPLMILLVPLMFLMVAVMDGAQIAVIVDHMRVMDAVKHALQVVRTHVWKFLIITLIVYFGGSLLSMITTMPLIMPVLLIPFLLELGDGMSVQSVASISVLFFCMVFPIIMLVSSLIAVFTKTALDITYLRLTSPAEKIENQGMIQ